LICHYAAAVDAALLTRYDAITIDFRARQRFAAEAQEYEQRYHAAD